MSPMLQHYLKSKNNDNYHYPFKREKGIDKNNSLPQIRTSPNVSPHHRGSSIKMQNNQNQKRQNILAHEEEDNYGSKKYQPVKIPSYTNMYATPVPEYKAKDPVNKYPEFMHTIKVASP